MLKYNLLYDVSDAVVLSFVFSFPSVKIVLEKDGVKYRVIVPQELFTM